MTNGGYLTKEEILTADDLSHEDVKVPEWGGTVRIREMTGAEREEFEQALVTASKDGGRLSNIRATLASLCIVDKDGQRLFNDAEVAQLGRKSGAALMRVFDACQKLNAMTPEEIKDLAKNSEPGLSAALSTD